MAIDYDPQFFVYTSDATPFRIEGVKALFDRLLRGTKPVVLFVHGRGKEPEKSLFGTGLLASEFGVEGHAVQKLEAYGSAVAMFSWDSQRGHGLRDRERPLANTPEGGRRFAQVIAELVKSLAEAPAQHPPVTLLAHSMGTIVVQRYVEQNGGWLSPGQGPLFSNVVLSSADADNIGHPAWVDKIAAVERVFVTVNPKDKVLRKSEEGRQPSAIALGRDPGAPVANAATYAMLEVKAHEIFSQALARPEIANFFAAAFGGTAPSGDPVAGPGHRIRLRP